MQQIIRYNKFTIYQLDFIKGEEKNREKTLSVV